MKIQKHIRQAALIALAAGFILTGCGQGNPIVSSAPEAVQAGEQVASAETQPRAKVIADVLNLNAEQRAVLSKLRGEYSANGLPMEDLITATQPTGPERESLEAQIRDLRHKIESAFRAILTPEQLVKYERLKVEDPDLAFDIYKPKAAS